MLEKLNQKKLFGMGLGNYLLFLAGLAFMMSGIGNESWNIGWEYGYESGKRLTVSSFHELVNEGKVLIAAEKDGES